MKTIHYIILLVVLAIAGGLIYFNEKKKKNPELKLKDIFSNNNNEIEDIKNYSAIAANNSQLQQTSVSVPAAYTENEPIYGKPEGFISPNDRLLNTIINNTGGINRFINQIKQHQFINSTKAASQYSYFKDIITKQNISPNNR